MKTFLNTYSDFPMFFTKNQFTRDINPNKGIVAIRESVKNIVLTNAGERAFDPYFGCSIYELLFESAVDSIRMLPLKMKLVNIIHTYESRVSVDEVKITNEMYAINITIEYTINSLNTRDKITISLERTR